MALFLPQNPEPGIINNQMAKASMTWEPYRFPAAWKKKPAKGKRGFACGLYFHAEVFLVVVFNFLF